MYMTEGQPILKPLEEQEAQSFSDFSERSSEEVLGQIVDLGNIFFLLKNIEDGVLEDVPKSANYYVSEIINLLRTWGYII